MHKYQLNKKTKKYIVSKPPEHGIGAALEDGQAKPAGHTVQFRYKPPSEYIPVGHGTIE